MYVTRVFNQQSAAHNAITLCAALADTVSNLVSRKITFGQNYAQRKITYRAKSKRRTEVRAAQNYTARKGTRPERVEQNSF